MRSTFYPARLIRPVLFLFFCAASVFSQTSAFTYQGRLTDGVTAASGTYQMQFALFDALSSGGQIGSTITNNSVTVTNGVFTVSLDFGSSPFAGGAARWLEVSVKKAAELGFTLLTPRQPLTSSPYSLRTLSATSADSLSAACVGCVTNAQISSLDGSKVTGSTVTNLNASNLASGAVPDARLSANVTVQGNTFNAANKLIKLDAGGKIPVLDGSQLTNLPASAPGGMLYFTVSNGNTYSLGTTTGTSSTRTFFPSLGGISGSGQTITFTLPPANSYPAGTTLRVYPTDYITSAPTFLFQRSSSDLLHGFNQSTGVTGPASFGTVILSWTTDGMSNWFRGN